MNGYTGNKQSEDYMTEQQQNQLENSMKDLLEKILTYMERFIKTKDDLQAIETKLNDYDNLNSLLDIIKSIFMHLTTKIDQIIPKQDKTQSKPNAIESNEDYDQLEKILQKHEAEIRTHIRLEQQLKLYAENLQSKLDECEQARSDLLDSTKQMINDVKRQNNVLGESITKLQQENQSLNEKIKNFNENEKKLEEKLYNMPYLQEKIQSLEKMVKDNMQDRYLTASMQNLQKENSFKKVNNVVEYDIKKVKKSETPPVVQMMMSSALHSTSPMKVERRAPTPNINSSGKVVKENSIKTSYQRFYNNVKLNRDENKDTRTMTNYSNNPPPSKNGINQLIQTTLRERDTKTLNSGGGSISNSHNNSFVCNNSNSSKNFKPVNHKRSKSHQVNKIRGMVNVNAGSKNPTDYSRLSNQDFSDIQITSVYNNK